MAKIFTFGTSNSLGESERDSEKHVHAILNVTVHAAVARFSRLHPTAGYPMSDAGEWVAHQYVFAGCIGKQPYRAGTLLLEFSMSGV